MLKTAGTLLLLCLILFLIGVALRNPVFTLASYDKQPTLPATKAQLYQHVKALVTIRPYRNVDNPSSLNKAADYIASTLKPHCDSVTFQNFKYKNQNYKNVQCLFKGQSNRRIIVGAHYDVAGDQDGADDNASGVAGLLELARLLKENKATLKYDVELVAYTLEEENLLGSLKHAQALKAQNIPVQFMLSVEMIGYYSEQPWSQTYPYSFFYLFYPNQGNFIALIGNLKSYFSIRAIKSALQASMQLPLYTLNAPRFVKGVDFSDHKSYWQLGYPAYMLTDTSFYRNPHYHQSSDTINTLDFNKMASVVNGLYGLVTANDSL